MGNITSNGRQDAMPVIAVNTNGDYVSLASGITTGVTSVNSATGALTIVGDSALITVSTVGSVITVSGNAGMGLGDVVGPSGATNNAVALYNGTTGELIKDSILLFSGNTLSSVQNLIISSPSGVNVNYTNGANIQQMNINPVSAVTTLKTVGATSSSVLNMNSASMDLTTSSVAGGGALTINPTNAKLEFSNGGGSNYVNLSGSAIVTLGNFQPSISGANTLGTLAVPYSGLHATKLNNTTISFTAFNEQPAGTVNGVNTVFTLAHTPTNNSLQLFNQGVYQILSGTHATANNYSLSSSTITFGVAPTSGNTLMASTYGYLV